MSSVEFLGCPFCGKDALVETVTAIAYPGDDCESRRSGPLGPEVEMWTTCCPDPSCIGHTCREYMYRSEEDAARAWNGKRRDLSALSNADGRTLKDVLALAC